MTVKRSVTTFTSIKQTSLGPEDFPQATPPDASSPELTKSTKNFAQNPSRFKLSPKPSDANPEKKKQDESFDKPMKVEDLVNLTHEKEGSSESAREPNVARVDISPAAPRPCTRTHDRKESQTEATMKIPPFSATF